MKAGLAESDDPAPDRNWWPEVVDHVVGLSLLPFFKRREEQRPHRVELENMGVVDKSSLRWVYKCDAACYLLTFLPSDVTLKE